MITQFIVLELISDRTSSNLTITLWSMKAKKDASRPYIKIKSMTLQNNILLQKISNPITRIFRGTVVSRLNESTSY